MEFTLFSVSESSSSEYGFEIFDNRHFPGSYPLNNPPAVSKVVEEVREAPVKKFGSFKVVNKRVKKVSLRTPLRPNHTYNAVSFNVTVKESARKWVFVTGFEASGLLGEMTIFKLVGRDVNEHIHSKNLWDLIHRKRYPMSWNKYTLLRLSEPVRIGPGETCGFYIHSNCRTDEGLMYRSCRPGVVMEDSYIQILHGWAHTSCIPFDLTRGWTKPNRVLSGNIFYEPTPTRWSPDRNFFWASKLSFQRALDAVMSTSYFSLGILVELMTFCGMDWFDESVDSISGASIMDDNERRHTCITNMFSGIFSTLCRSNSTPTSNLVPASGEPLQADNDEKTLSGQNENLGHDELDETSTQ